jgi:hypothetical protein
MLLSDRVGWTERILIEHSTMIGRHLEGEVISFEHIKRYENLNFGKIQKNYT